MCISTKRRFRCCLTGFVVVCSTRGSLAWTDAYSPIASRWFSNQQQSHHRPPPKLSAHPPQVGRYSDEPRSQDRTSTQFFCANGNLPNEVESQTFPGTSTDADDFIARGYAQFDKYFSFPLDDWQLHAGGAICSDCNVIVCAPTGAGKTVVGEMALLHAFYALHRSGIYTTPLKALSNQKYSDLCRIFGRQNTALSTGDVSINKGAQITVMTTEVYRNIAWRSSSPSSNALGTDGLAENAVVVLDEFHYMGHPGRGGVWEESVITSPPHSQIICLSATLSNGQALASWMEFVSGRRTVLVDVPNQERPVPLRYFFARKNGLYPLFRDPDAGPGAPKGLLGYRGDGIAQKEAKLKNRKKKGFKTADDDGDDLIGLPRGLQVNPALRDAAEARLAKVLKTIEKRKHRDRLRLAGDDSFFTGQRKMSPSEERRQMDRLLRSEMRREVPSLSFILAGLRRKKLLPAIFFIFSRAGCDEAARSLYQTMKGPRDPNRLLDVEFEQFDIDPGNQPQRKKRRNRVKGGKGIERDIDGRIFRPDVANDPLNALLDDSSVSLDEDEFDESSPLASDNWQYYSKAGLLEISEVKETASRIRLFNDQNPEIAFDDDVAEQFLFGIGSHHAGLLPSHKSFVEILFRRQLLKVVFATETLAAGINMPARTTVICSMAKRAGGSGMSLLETSNLLQMAGRAGRRGFDTEGTCVIVATPFETHDDAIKILTDPIKPIKSQFTPSYSLAVNLIARGDGKLDVARQLVGKSFGSWEQRQAEEKVSLADPEAVHEVVQLSAQERFMMMLVETLEEKRGPNGDFSDLDDVLNILKNRETLKKSSKSFASVLKALEQEESGLNYLELELKQLQRVNEGSDYEAMLEEDVSIQQGRIAEAQRTVQTHVFTAVAEVAQSLIDEETTESKSLREALAGARGDDANQQDIRLSASDLASFAKSAIVKNRKQRKFEKANPGLNAGLILVQNAKSESKDWESVLAITETLLSYGCLTMDAGDLVDYEAATFFITPAGMNIGMLGFENSLWVLVAIGGASYIAQESSAPATNENMDGNTGLETVKSDAAAVNLISELCQMDAAEFAGYISAIVAESSRNDYGPEALEVFRSLTQSQQRVVQTALASLDLFMEVQEMHSVDPGVRACNFDLSSMNVVTAWAQGCSWSEALSLSGLPPGDLVRTLSRVLDAVRQLGNLPYEPIRKEGFSVGGSRVSPGIHPQIRRLCRQAATAIDRYPLKDPLSFEASVDSDEEEFEEEEDEASLEE
ncbi:hypothetical protein ACA910_000153 [Epithemia clementina (nom. ined.)]